MALPRTREQRRRDTVRRLEEDTDCWVATADEEGRPSLRPLSYLWEDDTLLLATPPQNPTGRGLARGAVRIGLGATRDVVMVDGTVEMLSGVPDDVGNRFAARTGFDPRTEPNEYRYYRVTPTRIQAWREADELAGRDLMKDGVWLD